MIDELLEANRAYAEGHAAPGGSRPSRGLAVVTCMDTRIEVLPVLGLELGQAHVIRNAGARVTEDVLRSLALGSHVLGVHTVVVMQHTDCGVAGTSNAALQDRTGAQIDFLPISDHAEALVEDADRILSVPWLDAIRITAGFLYDVDSGFAKEVVRRQRNGAT